MEKSNDEKLKDTIASESVSSRWSDLWKTEDYWAIWLGFILLVISIVFYFPRGPVGMEEQISTANATLTTESEKTPFKTIAWYQAVDIKNGLKATSSPLGKIVKKFTNKPHRWESNPLKAFYLSEKDADDAKQKVIIKYNSEKEKEQAALATAKAAEKTAAAEGYRNNRLNNEAIKSIDAWRSSHAITVKAKAKTQIAPYNQIPYLIGLTIVLAIFFGIGIKIMGHSIKKFMIGFVFVIFISVLAYTAASNVTMNHFGIGYAAWAILFGLIISNTVGTPKWAMPAVQTEYFIKTGLVLLGAEILLGKIVSIGIPGLFVAWGVTPLVLITGFIFGEKFLKIPSKTLNITISAAFSVCGVSAAIATAAACRAKKEELTLAVGLSLIFTSLMMILMPPFIKIVGMGEILGGAWMGGTIDATGAVAAAGAFLGERSLYVSATIKMIQNILIGIIAFCVAVYWCAKIDCIPGQKVSAMEIWYRFPKFVLGFIIASILFSALYQNLGSDKAYVLIDQGAIKGMTSIFRGWFFCLAFTSIGLATNFRELKSYFTGGKPFTLYIVGQSFNLILTLLIAYIAFYLIFPGITAKI